jgi:hypothetical protein
MENAATLLHYVAIGSTTSGEGHDTGATTYPTSGGDVIGRIQTAATSGNAAIVMLDPESVAASSGSGSPGAMTILAKTANYTTVAADFSSATTAATEIVYTVSTSTAVTHTLPSALTGISTGGYEIVRNDCASTFGMYVAPNTLTLDGATTSFFLEPCDRMEIVSNGTNFISSLAQNQQTGGLPFPNNSMNGGIGAGFSFTTTANQPFVTKFVLQSPIKVQKFLVSVQTGTTSCVVDYALADVGKNILMHISSGQACTSGGNFNDSVTTPLVLAPGVYYLAGCTNVTATLSVGAYALSGAAAQFQQSAEAGSQGTAANSCTTGVFTNAALGTITNNNSPGFFPTVWAN